MMESRRLRKAQDRSPYHHPTGTSDPFTVFAPLPSALPCLRAASEFNELWRMLASNAKSNQW